MKFENLYSNEKQFLSLTSLLPSEFDELYIAFAPRWRQWYKHFNFRQKRRNKPLSPKQLNRPTRTLETDQSKLFFMLYMYKINPIQELAAHSFEMDQSQVSRWQKILTPILLQTLSDLGLQAARNTEELIRLFRNRKRNAKLEDQVESLHLDATERPIQRNLDYTAQRYDYSGKRRYHVVKNSLICDELEFLKKEHLRISKHSNLLTFKLTQLTRAAGSTNSTN